MSLIAIYRSRQEESFPPLKQEIERQKLPFLHFFGGKTKDLQSFRVTSRIFMGARKKKLTLKYIKSLVFFFSLKAHHESFIISLAASMEMIQKVENTTLQSIVKNATP